MSGYVGMGNNPIMMVDPDGELAWFVPIIVGAALGGTSGGIKSYNNGDGFLSGFWKGALIGAVAGTAAVGTGAALAGVGFTSGTSVGVGASIGAGAVGGGLNGGLNAAVFGGDVGRGIWTGILTGSVGAGVGGVISNTGHTGLGAFAGGASAGALGAGLNGGDPLIGALFGGAIGYGTYRATANKDFRKLKPYEKRGIRTLEKLNRSNDYKNEYEIMRDTDGKNPSPRPYWKGSENSVPDENSITLEEDLLEIANVASVKI